MLYFLTTSYSTAANLHRQEEATAQKRTASQARACRQFLKLRTEFRQSSLAIVHAWTIVRAGQLPLTERISEYLSKLFQKKEGCVCGYGPQPYAVWLVIDAHGNASAPPIIPRMLPTCRPEMEPPMKLTIEPARTRSAQFLLFSAL